MVRKIRFSMLALFIVALSAVITYSSTRWQQPAPPQNDLERLGVQGPVYQVTYSRTGTITVTYKFDTFGNIEEEIHYQNNQPYETIHYQPGDIRQNQLYPEIPIESTVMLKTDYFVKKGHKQNYDRYGNWRMQRVELVAANSDYHYTVDIAQCWIDNRSIQYFDDPALQPFWRETGPASIEFVPVP